MKNLPEVFRAGRSIGSGIFSEDIVSFSTTNFFLFLVTQKGSVFRQEFDVLPRQYTNGTVAIPLFLFEVFRPESWGHHNEIGILFLDLVSKACSGC